MTLEIGFTAGKVKQGLATLRRPAGIENGHAVYTDRGKLKTGASSFVTCRQSRSIRNSCIPSKGALWLTATQGSDPIPSGVRATMYLVQFLRYYGGTGFKTIVYFFHILKLY